jgi:crotonobetainyl-CoA:carnitine CoA-transferase CaiB-like acyl-CoA transferase
MEPLDGVRVIDFSRQLAGGGATRILANYGAEVLRVEWPEPPGIDFLRYGSSRDAPGPKNVNRGPLFNSINVGKHSVTLNMRTDGGRRVARELIKTSDLLLESMTPRVMRSWGLDYPSVRALKPDIVYVSCSGFGQTGPAADYRSYGMPSAAHTGIFHLAGLPGRPPARWGFSIGDTHASFMNAIAALAGLHHLRTTKQGVFIDSAQTQGNITLLGQFFLEASVNGTRMRRAGFPPGNRRFDPPAAPHDVYPCLEADTWCAIAVFSEGEWESLKDVMGRPAWAESPDYASMERRVANQDALDAALAEWTRGLDRFVLARMLQARGICAGPVQNSRDRLDWDPQLAHRGTYAVFEHPEAGRRRHETVGARLSEHAYRAKAAAPLMGEHTEHALRDLLGLSDQDIEALRAEDAIRI